MIQKSFGVTLELGECAGIDAVAVRQNRFENLAHLEPVGRDLVVVDIAARDRGLDEMPDERLLLERERREAVRIDLDDSRLINPLQQVLACFGLRRRRRLRAGRDRDGDQATSDSRVFIDQIRN